MKGVKTIGIVGGGQLGRMLTLAALDKQVMPGLLRDMLGVRSVTWKMRQRNRAV